MLALEQKQKLILSAQQQQSMQILQMSIDELTEYLKKEVIQNPVIELEAINYNEKNLEYRKQEWLLQQDIRNHSTSLIYNREKDSFLPEGKSSDVSETLEDHLLEQIRYMNLSLREKNILNYIAMNLDSNGFLTFPLEELSTQLSISTQEARKMLDLFQTLEPIGVGAGNLTECLLLQLNEDDINARHLVREHLTDIAKKQYDKLSEHLKITPDELLHEISKIQGLNPKPGRHFALREEVPYISPDILVVTFENTFQILLCDFYYPDLKVNEEYYELYRSSTDETVKEYLNENIQRYKWMKKSIESRKTTLLNIVKEIVEHQKGFFISPDYGLRPLQMKDIAKNLGVHPSTISRGVKGKYLQCASGIYPLSHFFVTELIDEKGNSTSTDTIRQALKDLIDKEDKSAPFSDSSLCNMLCDSGFSISRRTVAKYRNELNIPAAGQRY